MQQEELHLGPETTQWAWQGLFFELRDSAAGDWFDQIIGPWLEENRGVVEELREIGSPRNHKAHVVTRSAYFTVVEGLYGLSRVLDVLVSPFQPESYDADLLNWTNPGKPWWTGQIPPPATLLRVASEAGWTEITESRFHPFFHEIVGVDEADDPAAAPELVSEVWPGYFVGSMLLVRAGVIVRAGRDVLDPVVASSSCLYWAWWRRNRKVRDLSHGWGSNSQWGTDFRRDYWVDGELHYNVDGGHSGHRIEQELDTGAARQLLRYRCSIQEDLGCDQWPYYERYIERRPG